MQPGSLNFLYFLGFVHIGPRGYLAFLLYSALISYKNQWRMTIVGIGALANTGRNLV